jgi:hypothetical protein
VAPGAIQNKHANEASCHATDGTTGDLTTPGFATIEYSTHRAEYCENEQQGDDQKIERPKHNRVVPAGSKSAIYRNCRECKYWRLTARRLAAHH